ncbi:MAG TPA: LuxR C-terminal-related transcriptional regulator [Candidatus Limnocylindrales bacterium]|nr:LuxR C-terminal-related transcriptional regulator [Candidatus Limnocylindrales bacterium]
MSRGAAGRLRRADYEAILAFLAATTDLEPDAPYAPAFLGHLDATLRCGARALYRENDLIGRRTPLMVTGSNQYVDDDDPLYWTVGPDAITQYRCATGDLSAARLSDVVAWRRYRESPVYREYFGPGGVGHMLDLALTARPGWQRTLLFCREREDSDFSERDRDVLELLRPHLRAREARAALRDRLQDAVPAVEDGPAAAASLTIREREIVYLVGQGKSNAVIARELWITPGTVKKHLENVYAKLGVSSRAAAASRVRSLSAGPR